MHVKTLADDYFMIWKNFEKIFEWQAFDYMYIRKVQKFFWKKRRNEISVKNMIKFCANIRSNAFRVLRKLNWKVYCTHELFLVPQCNLQFFSQYLQKILLLSAKWRMFAIWGFVSQYTLNKRFLEQNLFWFWLLQDEAYCSSKFWRGYYFS